MDTAIINIHSRVSATGWMALHNVNRKILAGRLKSISCFGTRGMVEAMIEKWTVPFWIKSHPRRSRVISHTSLFSSFRLHRNDFTFYEKLGIFSIQSDSTNLLKNCEGFERKSWSSIEKKNSLEHWLETDWLFIGGLESSVLNMYVSRLFRIFFLLDLFLITRSLFLSIRYSRRYDSRGCISDVNYLQLSHDSHRSPDDKRVFTSRNILFS